MRVRKSFLFVGLLSAMIFVASCTKKSSDIPEAIDLQQVLENAWKSYDSFDFTKAMAQFDTVLTYSIFDPEPYLGKGLTMAMTGDYTHAHSYLNLSVFAAGLSADIFNPSDTIPANSIVVDSANGIFQFTVHRAPLIYPVLAKEVILDTVTGDTAVKALDIKYFRDNGYLETSAILPTGDSVLLFVLTRYYYLRPNLEYTTDYPLYAYIANGAAYAAEEDYASAIRNIRAGLFAFASDTSFAFEHYPYFTEKSAYFEEAFSLFKQGYFRVCVDIITQYLDPDWVPPADPNSYAGQIEILEELKKLEKEIGSIF